MNMNEYPSPHLPAEVHTDSYVSAHRRPPHTYVPPADKPAPRRRYPNLRTGLICLAIAVGLAAVLIPALRAAYASMDGSVSAEGLGQAIGQGLLQGGLPPTGDPTPGGLPTDTTVSDTDGETDGPATSAGASDGSEAEPATQPVTEPQTGEITEPGTEPLTEPPTETVSDAETVSGTETLPDTEPDPDTETAAEPETAIPVPDGCYPILSADVSSPERGVGYVVSDAGTLPSILPDGRLWSTEDIPTVLIVNTHPYEGYGDGGPWYDPASGGLAQTGSPNASDGTVALGASLARALRGMGVTVIHLRVAVSAEDSAADVYDRTETTIRYYCRLYPDIGLILDLRRSAELTDTGEILKTAGSYNGAPCAQARISVNGGRGRASVARDLAAALALREGLWGLEPSLSRPVWVRSGGGLVSDLADVCIMTLELGSAGNTYAEAEALVSPLAEVLGDMILASE